VYEGHFRQSNGYELPVEWTLADFQVGSESYLIGVVRDLSDRRDAEEERIESDRLQTLLEIAGGAAHEINQPLTAILGYAEMTESMLDDTHEVYIYQKHIIEATTRISEILKRMQEIREYRTRPYTSGYNIVDFSNQNENEADDLEP
jgi:signal transduction histidine kinase